MKRAIHKMPGKPATVVDVDRAKGIEEWERLRTFVGGYFEPIRVLGKYTVLVREDGMLARLQANSNGIVGPILVIRDDVDGYAVDMDESDQEVVRR